MQSLLDLWAVGEKERAKRTLELRNVLSLQTSILFSNYQPYKATPLDSALPFEVRLDRWLKQFANPEQQWSAFHSLKYFLYVGEQETYELYRCVFQREIIPWLADHMNLDIFSSTSAQSINDALTQSWPCPISDSFRINDFLHATGMRGQTYRPDWRSMKKFADDSKVQNYAQQNNLNYLVLLEDFVGSGTQLSRVLKYAMKSFKGDILLAPLVVCSKGNEVIQAIVDSEPNRVAYRPIIVFDDRFLITNTKNEYEPASFADLRVALSAAFQIQNSEVCGNNDTAFGFKGIGSLYSSFSNCPNNTPPAYHRTTTNWPIALFPRFDRDE
jgi:hypothetical protein